MNGDIILKINKKTGLLIASLITLFSIGSFVSIVDAESNGGVTLIQAEDSAPIGTIAMWGTSTPPKGWIEMNGSSISQYPKLSAIYGSTIPDMRGQFVRAWDNGAGIDSSRALLSAQSDAIRNITGSMTKIAETWYAAGSASGAFAKVSGNTGTNTPSTVDSSNSGGVTFDASRVVPTADENRPKNIALMFIVRAE